MTIRPHRPRRGTRRTRARSIQARPLREYGTAATGLVTSAIRLRARGGDVRWLVELYVEAGGREPMLVEQRVDLPVYLLPPLRGSVVPVWLHPTRDTVEVDLDGASPSGRARRTAPWAVFIPSGTAGSPQSV